MAKKGGSFWDNPFGGMFDFNHHIAKYNIHSHFLQLFAFILMEHPILKK